MYVQLGHPIYRQEPTRADKNRQEPTRGIFIHFSIKILLIRPYLYVIYPNKLHDCFCSPKNNEFTTLQTELITDKKFCEVVLAVYVGCHRDFSVI